jgi:hypothetical protein
MGSRSQVLVIDNRARDGHSVGVSYSVNSGVVERECREVGPRYR